MTVLRLLPPATGASNATTPPKISVTFALALLLSLAAGTPVPVRRTTMPDALDRMLSDGVRAALESATRLVLDADRREQQIRALIAAEIEQFADDDSDISDAYRHAALIAKGIPAA